MNFIRPRGEGEHSQRRWPVGPRCWETRGLPLRDLPYCRHMDVSGATVYERVCVGRDRGGENKWGEALLSTTLNCPRALWVITEKL